MLKILGKIALIIFVVEGLIMLALANFGTLIPRDLLPLVDAGFLSLLSFLPIFFWVIRPFVLARKTTSDALVKESAEKAAIIETVIEGIISIDDKGAIRTFNSAAEKIFGYTKSEVIGQSVNMLMIDDDSRHHDGYISKYSKTGVTNIMGVGRDLCGRRKDNSEFPMHLAVNKMKVSGKRMFVGVIRDLTEDIRTTNLLKEQVRELESRRKEVEEKQALLQKIMDNTGHGIVVFNRDLRLMAWNTTFLRLMDLDDEGYCEGMAIYDFFQLNLKDGDEYDQTIEEYVEDLRQKIKNRARKSEFSHDRMRPNGTIINAVQIIMRDGIVINTYRDVTAERKEEERIKTMALRDGLTGLANRRALNAQLDDMIDKYRHDDTPFILAYIDLDNFKSVNDTHGHAVGDNVLKFVAEILGKYTRKTDIGVRFGGDEFAIIFTGIDTIDLAIDRLTRIISDIKNKKTMDGMPLDIGASAGLACCPVDGKDVSGLMEVADKALYMAKGKGKGQVFYDDKN
ncbi:diguanylate cyclase/phosphodiesterase (GGDEF & EAL domains) with PAS/PAC sensor(s) [hydrothermal vent metagenome]|uniref:Diguanylate cyclase/phosphodiesterase (GGDEF & EAL domains) with PAS/PAC sensor(S) n=1 Tax=hydrothermal vent metagenome TaxID=652676 RepID=A0A3B0RFV0_9ZZZZ